MAIAIPSDCGAHCNGPRLEDCPACQALAQLALLHSIAASLRTLAHPMRVVSAPPGQVVL